MTTPHNDAPMDQHTDTSFVRRAWTQLVQYRDQFSLPLNILAMAIVLGILYAIGDWLDLLTAYFKWVFLPAAFCLSVVWIAFLDKSLTRFSRYDTNALWQWTYRAGIAFLFIAYMCTALYVCWRIRLAQSESVGRFWMVFSTLSIVGWLALWRIVSEGDTTRLDIARIGVVSWSIIAAWAAGSAAYSPLGLFESPPPLKQDQIERVFHEREAALKSNVKVAVALSGGGYRAATIHAGVLDVLDGNVASAGTKRIPIDYLSTVSGGSIVGSFYALGHRPQEFLDLLTARPPGLANDLFHITTVSCQFLCPSRTDSDTYAEHFRRVYFPNATFSDIRYPSLAVNVTNYRSRKREIFSNRINAHRSLSLADTVAASGAFPGAFEPKRIAVPSDNGTIEEQRYIDGGVVENLGLEGLRLLLTQTDRKAHDRPDLIIVSDASKADTLRDVTRKEFRFNLLMEATSISYEALHRKLYRLFTNNQYDHEWSCADAKTPCEQPYHQPYVQNRQHIFLPRDAHNEMVFVFVLDGTSETEAQYMARRQKSETGNDVCEKALVSPNKDLVERDCTAARVAALSTLKELSTEEVTMGAWVGRTIAARYTPAIECVIEQIPGLKSAIQSRDWQAENIKNTCGALIRNQALLTAPVTARPKSVLPSHPASEASRRG